MRRPYIRFPWKRNLLKIPDWILAKAENFSDDEFVAACVKRISIPEVEAGRYAHLDIKFEGEELQFPESRLPSARAGRYSLRNAYSHTLVRKDLPKITRTYSMEVPNFGDWSKGSHTVDIPRQVYRRDQIPPKRMKIAIELLEEEKADEGSFVFKFRVDEVMVKGGQNLLSDLLFNLNLLQENVGSTDVFPANATLADYLRTIQVNWEILPPGERERNMAKMLSRISTPSPEVRERFEERYDLLAELKPIAFVKGTGGFRRYFGAKFADDLVVLENMEYGNAIYIMFEEWQSLSKKSRTELLEGDTKGFVRIIHKPGWDSRLRELVA